MPDQTRIVAPGPNAQCARAANNDILRPPADWTLVPPGDPALTRRLKAAGPTWTVQEKKGRKIFSKGVWAPLKTVEAIRAELMIERDDPAHAKRRQADARRRDVKQALYVGTFHESVLAFLAFAPRHADLAERLAKAVTVHATPVGSGTVARTRRIPVEQRAEAAVIAWMRHQTTAYDSMPIPRIEGKRREVRRMLAARSQALLERYRSGAEADDTCPLRRAVAAFLN